LYASKTEFFAPLQPDANEADLLRLRCDSQSMSFYADISRFLAARLLAFETLSLLDIGPRTGAGLALLRMLHHPAAFTRIKLDPVVGLDIEPAFEAIAAREFRDLGVRTGNVSSIESKSFDIVICSHTIDLVPNTQEFVAQLERIARRAVVLASPIRLPAELPSAQVVVLTEAVLESMGYFDVEIYDSFHRHDGPCCLAYKPLAP
jgi:2-polyprenyl-3-methyl-5-hydroxy-6-metoxy-1,4-benzoquinol methylase